MAQSLQCEPLALPTRRTFWTTQSDACGITPSCDAEKQCGQPGLSLIQEDAGSRIATNDWVRSLALNMLLTDARKRDTRCGHLPGTLNGHWSESFMQQSGQGVGSHVRYIGASISVRDAMALIKAEVEYTLQKLIDYGIAIEISVTAEYRGISMIHLDIEILGTAVDPTRLGVTAQRNENSWAWMT